MSYEWSVLANDGSVLDRYNTLLEALSEANVEQGESVQWVEHPPGT